MKTALAGCARTCPTCKKRFVPEHGNLRYCTFACVPTVRPERPERKVTVGDERVCVGCEQPFELTNERQWSRTYCTRKCSNKHRARRHRT